MKETMLCNENDKHTTHYLILLQICGVPAGSPSEKRHPKLKLTVSLEVAAAVAALHSTANDVYIIGSWVTFRNKTPQ